MTSIRTPASSHPGPTAGSAQNPYQSPQYESPPDPFPDQSDDELRKRIGSWRVPIITLLGLTALSCALIVVGIYLHEPEDPDVAIIIGGSIAFSLPMLLWCLWSRHKLVRLLADRQGIPGDLRI